MDMRQMEYFLAVVDCGGVTRAAAQLRVAQPSLSQAVRKLEKDLGVELFHRVGRGLVLSPAGEALVGPARSILREVESAENAVRDVGAMRGGRIDIASLSDLSSDPLSVWVAKFRRQYPEVRFHIEERDETADIVSLVRSGACELGILALPLPTEDLVGEELIDQHLVLVCPPGTDARWPDPVPITALTRVPFVMGEKGTATRDFIDRSLRLHGVEPDVAVEVRQRGAVLPIVLAGGGVSIVALRSGLDAMLRGGVVRELSPRLTRRMGVVRRPGRMTQASTEFLACARASFEEFAASIAVHMSSGVSLVEAAKLTRAESDRRIRDDNARATNS
ncbi:MULTISPECIES: LysR family transcriptional regulator [Rhodococcus]|uniref:LysR family transcriptional regulator n=1 Tax=Rhodococcus TaxID=1827 RepID=UPI00146B02F0|nr:LysR family transcriptional regulator [Rhodococcus opacus]QZS58753.1 LysR family transcriptional regulator [Rhodococcus opacus]WKN55134.1 LysR family transcriptional regulator [Rhodococcus opacus]